ncbi:hypothetical protein [Acidisoma sp. 7E03]
MARPASIACAAAILAACLSGPVMAQNAPPQATATVTVTQMRESITLPAPRAVAPPPQQQMMTQTARLAKAKEIVMHKTTTAGETMLIARPASLAPDCTPLGDVDAKVILPPGHGKVSITAGTAFPNYAPGDPPYACNSHRSPATIIAYQAKPGYVGQDETKVQIFFPDGDAPLLVVHITVD